MDKIKEKRTLEELEVKMTFDHAGYTWCICDVPERCNEDKSQKRIVTRILERSTGTALPIIVTRIATLKEHRDSFKESFGWLCEDGCTLYTDEIARSEVINFSDNEK